MPPDRRAYGGQGRTKSAGREALTAMDAANKNAVVGRPGLGNVPITNDHCFVGVGFSVLRTRQVD